MSLNDKAVAFVRDRAALREPIREVLTRVSTHRPGPQNDIMIYACRRSGSTWLMELLASQPRMRYVVDPCSRRWRERQSAVGLRAVLLAGETKIITIPPEAESLFRDYLRDPAATRICTAYNPFSSTFHLSTDRRVVKIVNATAVADWIDDQALGFDVICLVRHPVPTVLSMVKAGMTFGVEANLNHESFVERFLSPDQVEFAKRVIADGSELERCALEWSLDNLGLMRAVQAGRGWAMLTYEEINLSPIQTIEFLSERFGLERPDLMLRQVGVASSSTASSRLEAMAQEGASRRVAGWQDSVDEATQEAILGICDSLGVDIYQRGQALARPEWIRFAETSQAL